MAKSQQKNSTGPTRKAAKRLRFSIRQDVKIMADFDDLWQMVDENRVSRIMDIGCHQGRHIVEILRPKFPNAEIVGIEPKHKKFQEMQGN